MKKERKKEGKEQRERGNELRNSNKLDNIRQTEKQAMISLQRMAGNG